MTDVMCAGPIPFPTPQQRIHFLRTEITRLKEMQQACEAMAETIEQLEKRVAELEVEDG